MNFCLVFITVLATAATVSLTESVSATDKLEKEDIYAIQNVSQACPKGCECFEPWNVECYSIKGVRELPQNITDLTIDGRCNYFPDGCIYRLEKDLLTNLPNLESLTIYNTKVQALPDGIFDGHDKLRKLELKMNPLIFPRNKTVFAPLKNLTSLSIIASDIVFLDESLFFGLEQLEDLELHGNSLRCFPKNIFQNLPSLTYVGLNGNKLKNFSYDGALNTTGNLEYIHLEGNAIESLTINNTANLKEIHVGRNNLQCSCQLYQLVLKLAQSNVYVKGECSTFGDINNSTQQHRLTKLPDAMRCPGLFHCEPPQPRPYYPYY